jgi:hypothetical protein
MSEQAESQVDASIDAAVAALRAEVATLTTRLACCRQCGGHIEADRCVECDEAERTLRAELATLTAEKQALTEQERRDRADVREELSRVCTTASERLQRAEQAERDLSASREAQAERSEQVAVQDRDTARCAGRWTCIAYRPPFESAKRREPESPRGWR